MPKNTNITALRERVKLGLLKEAYARKLVSEREFMQLTRLQKIDT